MSDVAVEISNISKRYRLGTAGGERMLRDAIHNGARRVMSMFGGSHARDKNPGEFWALKDVSFNIKRGDVVGIIGRNGAGKSTLLKILSRITDPTEGRARIRGRVGSLLEVGTGFHPELTGRENVFLNGAILGMRRAEIKSKFDQIVDFSGIEGFIDTPVKRYSSGMYVRLAFAVAAHLDPEIMIVDEVLAVGDAAFQAKCLGKMQDAASGGRTVLFVSHNMDAVASLCSSIIYLESGRNSEALSPEDGIKKYMTQVASEVRVGALRDAPRNRFGHDRPPIITELNVASDSTANNVVSCGEGVTFDITLENIQDQRNVFCWIAILNERTQRVLVFHSEHHSLLHIPGSKKTVLRCRVPSLPLIPADYIVELTVNDGRNPLERIDQAERLHVHFADVLGTNRLPNDKQGNVVLPATWSIVS